MVHLVILEPTAPTALPRIEESLMGFANGWVRIRPRVWLIGTDLDAGGVRDLLSERGLQVLVLRQQGNWASVGFGNVADWLRGARDAFR